MKRPMMKYDEQCFVKSTERLLSEKEIDVALHNMAIKISHLCSRSRHTTITE